MSKKISIIIPVFNGEAYITESIMSALNQDYPYKEVIVINDGSTDKTEEICQSFGKKIIYYAQENKGASVSRNQGVSLATGQHIAFLDCDDLWEPTKLSRQMQFHDDDALTFTMIKQFYCPSLSADERTKVVIPQEVMPGYSCTCLLVSLKRFKEIGEFQTIDEPGEFIGWYSQAMALNVRANILNEILAYRRVHANNVGRQRERYSRQGFLTALRKNVELGRQKDMA